MRNSNEGGRLAASRPPRCLLRLLSKFEGDQRRSCWYLFKLREQRWKQDCGVRPPTTWHQNVLLAVDGVADDAAAHSGACIEAPQHLSGVGIEGPQDAHWIAVEHQPAACGQDAGEARDVHLICPFSLAREWIVRIEPAGFAPIGCHYEPPEII